MVKGWALTLGASCLNHLSHPYLTTYILAHLCSTPAHRPASTQNQILQSGGDAAGQVVTQALTVL